MKDSHNIFRGEIGRRELISGAVGAALGMTALAGTEVVLRRTRRPETRSSSETERAPAPAMGIDIPSWIDSGDLPSRSDFDFVVININGGLPTDVNPNLKQQLKWAGDSTEINGYPSVQFGCNAADPYGAEKYTYGSWPNVDDEANGGDAAKLNPYDDGVVGGRDNNNLATNWQYGWNRATYIVDKMASALGVSIQEADFSKNMLWIDVNNTVNSWQTGSDEALARNAAVLEGMVAYFKHVGVPVGLYSKRDQFGAIVGDQVRPDSDLNGLDSWVGLGYVSKEDALAELNANKPGLTTNSRVVMVQRVVNENNVERNYSYLAPQPAS